MIGSARSVHLSRISMNAAVRAGERVPSLTMAGEGKKNLAKRENEKDMGSGVEHKEETNVARD